MRNSTDAFIAACAGVILACVALVLLIPSLQYRAETDSIQGLTVDEAEALAQHNSTLDLRGLTTLTDEAAQALAKHKGRLHLNDLTTLSDEAAEALAQHKGGLLLSGLTTLSDEAAAALRANPEVYLPVKFKQ